MNYNETLEYIHNTPKFSRILGNDLLRALLKKLGNPHEKLRFIHIAGTNGKGSTAAMLSCILTDAGYKTGLFTSPYIERFNERMQINNTCIEDDELAELATLVRNTIEKYDCPVSEFALDTTIAFLYFLKHKCDIVVLETGLGGRIDATNVIKTSTSVITSISLDHTQYLGDTIEQIAAEKAGIIKPCTDVILYSENPKSVYSVIKERCKSTHSALHISDTPVIKDNQLIYKNTPIKLPLGGTYQFYNAMTVIKTVEILIKNGYNISHSNICRGISSVNWPVRFEYISDKLIIDGAHNPDAIEKFCSSLAALNTDIYPVIAMMEDKAVDECVQLILRHFKKVITTQINMPRCMTADNLKNKFIQYGGSAVAVPDVEAAITDALSSGSTVCSMGSLYLAGEVRRIFKDKI